MVWIQYQLDRLEEAQLDDHLILLSVVIPFDSFIHSCYDLILLNYFVSLSCYCPYLVLVITDCQEHVCYSSSFNPHYSKHHLHYLTRVGDLQPSVLQELQATLLADTFHYANSIVEASYLKAGTVSQLMSPLVNFKLEFT